MNRVYLSRNTYLNTTSYEVARSVFFINVLIAKTSRLMNLFFSLVQRNIKASPLHEYHTEICQLRYQLAVVSSLIRSKTVIPCFSVVGSSVRNVMMNAMSIFLNKDLKFSKEILIFRKTLWIRRFISQRCILTNKIPSNYHHRTGMPLMAESVLY